MNESQDPKPEAVEELIRETGHLLRRLALSCGFIAVRLGDERSARLVSEAPERLVAYGCRD